MTSENTVPPLFRVTNEDGDDEMVIALSPAALGVLALVVLVLLKRRRKRRRG